MAMRISGLSSGMDIDSMVSSMMKPEQIRIDRVSQQKTKGQWVQEAYHEVSANLARFVLDRKNDFGLTTNAVNGTIMNNSAANLTWLKTATVDNQDVLSVTAGTSAIDGSFKINVKALAQSWSAASNQALPQISEETLDTLANRFALNQDSKIDFTITTNKGKLRITSDQAVTEEAGTKLIKLDLGKNSIVDIGSMITSANIGLKANFDAGTRRFFLQTASSGNGNTLKINDVSTGLGAGLNGFISGSSNALKLYGEGSDGLTAVLGNTEYKGTDAVIDMGAAKDVTQSTNVFKINGININLKKKGEVNVQVATDVNSAFDKVKEFVDEYNKLVGSINTKLGEKNDRDYSPLTDEQKKSMSEDQIKKWEEKAKAGLLNNNYEISTIFSSIRSSISNKVEGVDEEYNSLYKIGITTEAYSRNSAGKLVIDEWKLKDALQKNAEGVVDLLFKSPDANVTDKAEQKKKSGVVNKLFIDIIDGIKSVVNKAGAGNNASLFRSVQTNMLIDFISKQGGVSTLDKDMNSYQTRLSELNEKYTAIQTRYYNKFTAMEQAINRANSQSAWLSQQLGNSAGS